MDKDRDRQMDAQAQANKKEIDVKTPILIYYDN